MKRYLVLVFVAFMATVGLVACGDDDEGDLVAYCTLTAELDGQEDFPTDEQLDEIQDVAPDEIRDEVELVAERFKEANDNPQELEDVFSDPEIEAAFTEIEAFEDANCPDREDDDDVEGDVTTTTVDADDEDEVDGDGEDTTTTTLDTDDETTETTTTTTG